MSSTKTFLTLSLLILLGSMGAVQAQDAVTRFELFTTPSQSSREGGIDELGGAVFLTASAENAVVTTAKITLHFSAPFNDGLIVDDDSGLWGPALL